VILRFSTLRPFDWTQGRPRSGPRPRGGRRLRLLGIFLDTQAPPEYNIYQTNITESHKQKNRKQNMADTKIKPQHHPAKSFLKSPLSLYFLAPSCLSGQTPRSTLVETPLQIHLFFAKRTQFLQQQKRLNLLRSKGLRKQTAPPHSRKRTQTNPIKPNFKMGNLTISAAQLKAYANKQRTMNNERYSKQTQSNPISNDQTQFQTQKQLTQLAGREIATSSFSAIDNSRHIH